MKKLLFIIPLLFLSVNVVKADTIVASNFYNAFQDIYSDYQFYETKIQEMESYYQSHFSNDFPYYAIVADRNNYPISGTYNFKKFSLYYGSSPIVFTSDTLSSTFGSLIFNSNWSQCSGYQAFNQITYLADSDTFTYHSANDCSNSYSNNENQGPIVYLNYLDETSSAKGGLYLIKSNGAVYSPTDNFSNISVPSYTDDNTSISAFTINYGDTFPDILSLYDGSYQGGGSTANYTEVDLTQYKYIILSLKDYTQASFTTNIYTLGSLCLTPVYNYGLTERKDILGNDTKVQACSTIYNSFTPVSIVISDDNIQNKAVYYIAPYSTTLPNKVKINTDLFNISYITSQNEDNPSVLIDGRSYPVIPFSDLSDTANKSTDEGYISGKVCALGDVNCEYGSIGLDISDLWTQPLKVLQSVWASITSVFAVITEFIMLIPSPLREFLISAFFLSVILGVLKILL